MREDTEEAAGASPPNEAGAAEAPANPEEPTRSGKRPLVLALGEYLNGSSEGDKTPWVLRLGEYLREKQPAPWNLAGNERPHDPLVRLR